MINITLLLFLFIVAMFFASIMQARSMNRAYIFIIFVVLFFLGLFLNDNYVKPLKYE